MIAYLDTTHWSTLYVKIVVERNQVHSRKKYQQYIFYQRLSVWDDTEVLAWNHKLKMSLCILKTRFKIFGLPRGNVMNQNGAQN